jgi:hypothetical protein
MKVFLRRPKRKGAGSSSNECECECEECQKCERKGDAKGLAGSTKRALLIGINYYGSSSELRGCHEDVSNMEKYLRSKGFKDIVILLDDRAGNTSPLSPKKDNIIRELSNLASRCKSGDLVVVHYSGHGSQLPCVTGEEKDGKDETWCPVDFDYTKRDYGFIRDNQINDILVKGLPSGTKLRIFSDSCHSGSIGDLPLIWISGNLCKADGPVVGEKDVIIISGCRDEQTSADAYIARTSQGAMTWSLLASLAGVGGVTVNTVTWPSIIEGMRKRLADGKYAQVPQLSLCSKDQLKHLVDII